MHPQELVGPMIEAFIPALEKVDQKKDRRLSMLVKIIAECVSIHSAATWLIENQPWDFFAVYYDAIDHFCHGFMKYHPPRQPWIAEADFELYSNVVSAAYKLHDQMLGRLLHLAGGDVNTILMSDHGFHPDHLRPRAIPDIPAGPAIEHSRYGIFVMAGPGIKKDDSLFGVSVLDLAPTLLTLYGLPVGDDMDGRVISDAFEARPEVKTIPSWEDVPGEDGRHPPHTRLDPVAAAEALEQLVALGYIEKPGDNVEDYIERTVRELRFNLLEAYQDASRHQEALEIARDLCRRDPDEQRFALKRFLSCQALGLVNEMSEIVDDLDGRRRKIYDEAVQHMQRFRDIVKERARERLKAKSPEGEAAADEIEKEIIYELNPNAEPDEPRESLLNAEERKEMLKWRNLRRYQPSVVDYLRAQALTALKRWFEALEALERVRAGHLVQPALLLHSADLYRRLGRLAEAEKTYRAALAIDPDNAQAYMGLSRTLLRRRDYEGAAQAAQECIARVYFFPMAHFLLGVARVGLKDYARAAEEFRTALSQNPHFPQAHLWLGRLFKLRLMDSEAAEEHFRYYREMRKRKTDPGPLASPAPVRLSSSRLVRALTQPLAPLGDGVLVVSGLPRSGTSMLMQMLRAGGISVLTDLRREADEDNPKGYFEFEAVKKIFVAKEGAENWIADSKGKAVKIVAPLVCSIPAGPQYRVILIERSYDEILASQAKMIERRGESMHDSPERRDRLKREYARIIDQTKAVLSGRPDVEMLSLRYGEVVQNPDAAARQIGLFAGGGLDVRQMVAAVEPSLHRNRGE
jgi:tetratricopeptide (TPR) repeat protein